MSFCATLRPMMCLHFRTDGAHALLPGRSISTYPTIAHQRTTNTSSSSACQLVVAASSLRILSFRGRFGHCLPAAHTFWRGHLLRFVGTTARLSGPARRARSRTGRDPSRCCRPEPTCGPATAESDLPDVASKQRRLPAGTHVHAHPLGLQRRGRTLRVCAESGR